EVAEVGGGVRGDVDRVVAGSHAQRGGGAQGLDVGRVVARVGVQAEDPVGVVDGERLGQRRAVGADDTDETEGASRGRVVDGDVIRRSGEARDLAVADDDVAVAATGAEAANREGVAAGAGIDGQGGGDGCHVAGVGGRVGADVDGVVAGAGVQG